MIPVNPALDALGNYPLAEFQQLAAESRADPEVADFSIGDPDEPTPPFIRSALIDALGPVSSYPSAVGAASLREAVAAWVHRRHGVEVDPERHVLASAGSKEAIFHLPLALVDPVGERRHVLWGDPGYPVYERGARFAGGISDPVRLDATSGWRLQLDRLPPVRLERACLAWINYPHNPTGATASRADLARWLETTGQHELLLASDECYQEVWFDEPAPSILEVADDDLTGVLAVVSLSKRSGMTGYRSGAMIGDADVIARLKRLRPSIGAASPSFVQAAATAAWQDQDHVDERRAVFAAKRDIVLPFLRDLGIEVAGSDATFYVWFRAPGGDDDAYARALLAERIIATPGRAFGAGGEGYVRLALVPTVEGCRIAVTRWRDAAVAGRLPGHGETAV